MAGLNVTIPALKLNDGASIPMLGYGVGTAWGKKDESKLDQAIVEGVKTAIKLGYYHLDGAECESSRLLLTLLVHVKVSSLQLEYRHWLEHCTSCTNIDHLAAYKNEIELGQGIKESGVDRSKLFVTTKVWEPTGEPGDIERALKQSLKKLQLEYIDLWVLPTLCYIHLLIYAATSFIRHSGRNRSKICRTPGPKWKRYRKLVLQRRLASPTTVLRTLKLS